MNSRVLGLLAVGLIAAPMAAKAQTETLDYIGSPFTSLTASGNLSIALSNSIPENTGQLVLSSPLGDSLNNVAVTPLSYSFDSSTQFGSLYLNSNNPFAGEFGESTSFTFSTNASGMLTGWDINVVGGIFVGTNSPSSAAITIRNAGDSFSSGFSTPSCAAPPGVPIVCYQIAESNSAPGYFTSTIAAPEIDPASTVGAMTLLLGGLAVLRGRRDDQRVI